MTSKLTREKVQWLHDAAEEAAAVGMKLTMTPDEILMFTSAILAAMDSEPVAYIDKQWTLVYYVPPMSMGLKIGDKLYRHAQPAPVAPDRSIFEQWWESQNGVPLDGWDSLRTTDGYCDDGIDGQFEAWNAAMLQAGNSPVIPDGWIPVSERMPETDGNYWGWWSESKRQGPAWFIKSELQAQFQSHEITHWMPLPAAPREAK